MLKFERMNVDFKEKKIFITAVKLQIFPWKGTAIERRDIRSLNIPLLKV